MLKNTSISPLVSVVLTTYKRPSYLKRAIDTVLGQTYTNYELIIVDDNNEDDEFRKQTANVIKECAPNDKIIYVKHEKNRGGSAARNSGARIAKGKYVAFYDDDDEWYPKKLEKQINYFEFLDNSVGAIYCSYVLVRDNKELTFYRTEKGNLTHEILTQSFVPGASSALVFRRNVLSEIGYFDESFIRHQDLEILLRMFKRCTIDVCPEVLLKINGHNNPSATKMKEVKKHFLSTFSKEINNLSFMDRRKVFARHYFQLAVFFFREDSYIQFGKYITKSFANYILLSEFYILAMRFISKNLKKISMT